VNDALELLRLNLLSPMVLAFVLGLIAVWVRSDLKFPDAMYSLLSIYLLFSIGIKGGAELSVTPLSSLVGPLLATLALGIITPLLAFTVLKTRFDQVNAGAIAAHYGSVSAVTFTAALSFAQERYKDLEGFLPALVAVLEVPGIAIGIALAQRGLKKDSPQDSPQGSSTLVHELLTGKGLFVLLGGLAIGAISGKGGLTEVAPLFIDPFKGALTLFLLELGIIAGQRLREIRQAGPFLIGFGVLMPMVNGSLGVALGTFAGLSEGGAFVLGTLAASASYIAAPAAVRSVLPQANPGYALGASLGVTFPFNLALGIPLYAAISSWMH
jgi:uncharacterized protein